jgi:hypothetical protein
VYTLADFSAANEARRSKCAARLDIFFAEVRRAVEGSCAASLEALEVQLESFAIKQVGRMVANYS